MNDLYNVAKGEDGLLICYTDDTNLVGSHRDLDPLLETGGLILKRVTEYFNTNRLLLNISKTKCILFGSQRTHLPQSVEINGDDVPVSESTKFLGLTVDARLKWDQHINTLCNKLSSSCYALREIKKYVNKETLMQIVLR